MSRIALLAKTYAELDLIQLAWMVNQMESYEPDATAPSAFLSRERNVVSGGGRLALHLIHGWHKAVGVRQLRRKVALSS